LNKEILQKETEQKEIPQDDWIGDDHLSGSVETPLRPDAFELSDEEKIAKIEHHFSEIMTTLGLDLHDQSLRGTPHRVAKMYVREVFYGLKPENRPTAKKFENSYSYRDMVVVKNINVTSFCEHHFLPFLGRAHVAYMSGGKVIGLSKINRIVDYYSRRPQVQERLNLQIVQELQAVLNTQDVACVIDAKHLCVNSRGISDISSSTVTSEFGGVFKSDEKKREFLDYIQLDTTF